MDKYADLRAALADTQSADGDWVVPLIEVDTIRALLAERDRLREALRWAAGTLQSACCLSGPISENSPFKLVDETRTVAQICDAADAALAQEVHDAD